MLVFGLLEESWQTWDNSHCLPFRGHSTPLRVWWQKNHQMFFSNLLKIGGWALSVWIKSRLGFINTMLWWGLECRKALQIDPHSWNLLLPQNQGRIREKISEEIIHHKTINHVKHRASNLNFYLLHFYLFLPKEWFLRHVLACSFFLSYLNFFLQMFYSHSHTSTDSHLCHSQFSEGWLAEILCAVFPLTSLFLRPPEW